MIVTLDSDARKEYAAKQLARVPVDAGMEMEIRVHADSRTLAQNRKYWAILNEITAQMPAQLDSTWYSAEMYHEYFKRLFLGTEVMEIDGKIYHAPKSTRKLKVKPFAKYLEKLDWWCAEHNVNFDGGL